MSMQVANTTVVGLASIATLRSHGTLLCPGLGSSIAVCAYDSETGIGGVAHLMLPSAPAGNTSNNPARFVDAGMDHFLEHLRSQGVKLVSATFATAGGAQIFAMTDAQLADLGTRNVDAIHAVFKRLGLPLAAEDVGGNLGRSLSFRLETGDVLIRTLAYGEKHLANLRNPR